MMQLLILSLLHLIMNTLYPALEQYLQKRSSEFNQISHERKEQLRTFAEHIRQLHHKQGEVPITFICTHNSRRSHFAQVWMTVAAYNAGLDYIRCYSGGTEATACNPRTIAALQRAGFQVSTRRDGDNPHYQIRFASDAPAVIAYSKVYDAAENPQERFIAVMTCSQADEACPAVRGAAARVALPYEDPKKADGTPQEASTYDARCAQIAREMLYVVSLLAPAK
ncbi:low molecular weight phosphatase family protein [Thermonema sp.]|uniref:arsenate-mycothiol transferase ArsC n=1 Tax=Thermonema sp. TaxID=2231181 RepID=UPI00258AEF3D|nr:protein-tyrosine-phosphatase [Thermonema sp.]